MPRAPKASAVQIRRAIKATQAAGLPIARIEVDGMKIVVFTQSQASEAPKVSALDSWRERRRRGNQKSQQGSQEAG